MGAGNCPSPSLSQPSFRHERKISTMAWKTVRYRLTSSAPLIQHNGQTADPTNKWAKAIKQISGKRNKTDADYEEMARLEFLAGLYMGPDGPVLPAKVIDGLIVTAAKKTKEGQTAKSGIYCLEPSTLEYEGPREASELWADEDFRFSAIVRIRSARVVRMRPIFQDWSATINVSMEDTILNVGQLDDWMHVAGTQIGIGDWRPQYGRFTAERLDGE